MNRASFELINGPIKDFPLLEGKCLISGVLNATPDSFSDGGQFTSDAEAIKFGEKLLKDGANFIDIGGESTGPGSQPVEEDEELRRILNVVKAIATRCLVSVDTFKSAVARRALEAGAKIINDVSALRYDKDMTSVIKDFNAKVILMYSKEDGASPHVSDREITYTNVALEVRDFLERRIEFALSEGIEASNIIVDPGMGRFIANDPEISWTLLRNLEPIVELGFPVMLGTSRKGFLGGKVDERELSSALTSLFGALNGTQIIRTHNPKMMRESLLTWQKLNLS